MLDRDLRRQRDDDRVGAKNGREARAPSRRNRRVEPQEDDLLAGGRAVVAEAGFDGRIARLERVERGLARVADDDLGRHGAGALPALEHDAGDAAAADETDGLDSHWDLPRLSA